MKALPIGVQTFKGVINDGYLYIDKTKDIYNIIRSGKIFFLSRPRRFGKSLMLDTIANLFKGEKELFKGLWIEDKWDWEDKYPVIKLDFGAVSIKSEESVSKKIIYLLKGICEAEGIDVGEIGLDEYGEGISRVISKLKEKYKKNVVVLIDEYDSPIISNLDDIEKAKNIRDLMREFYKQLKASEGNMRFLLLTGVSKFSKAGVFSALNNLMDLTLSPLASTVCGITQKELEEYFKEGIEDIAQRKGMDREELLSQIKKWYNGYCFDLENGPNEENKVYNPFSTLNFFLNRTFNNYWYTTGSPKFLIDLLKENNYPIEELESKMVNIVDIDAYEPDNLNLLALLVQTGYLTIKKIVDIETIELDYPNYEVEKAFINAVAKAYIYGDDSHTIGEYDAQAYLKEGDIEGFMEWLKRIYANVPYDITDRIRDKEQYYQTTAYLIFHLLGLRTGAEVRTNRGRIDIVVELENKVYIIEMKIGDNAQDALDQIKEKGYADRYKGSGREVILLGIGFDIESRNISDYLVEPAS